jgi:MFS family permease
MSSFGPPPVPPPPGAYLGPTLGDAPLGHDVQCRKCGYNLRGLNTNGRCPECGTAVGYSLQGDLLRFCDPNWVDTLYRGTRLFIWGIVVIFVSALSVGFLANALGGGAVLILFAVAALAGWILVTVGWWLMTEPDPSGLGEEEYGTARKIIRVALIVGVAQNLLEMLTNFVAVNESLMIGLRILIGIAGLVAAVGIFAQLSYLKKIALRIPDPKLSGRANFLMYAFGISYGLLILMGIVIALAAGGRTVNAAGGGAAGIACFAGLIGLAALVFAIMYLLLVERMGKRFKEQAQAARTTWAATAFTR